MKKFCKRRLLGCLFVMLFLIAGSMDVDASGEVNETIRLKEKSQIVDTPFDVENMFPGDRVANNYTVRVKHKKPILLYYHAEIQEGYEKLAEVLKVKIELPQKDVVLYDGLMKDMPDALENSLTADEKEVLYHITVYLDTSVGNEYQYQELKADFRWWYIEETDQTDQGGSDSSIKPEDSGESPDSTVPDGYKKPGTGDDANIALFLILLVGAGACLLILFAKFRKKKNEDEENG